jgi:hypothetical protein
VSVSKRRQGATSGSFVDNDGMSLKSTALLIALLAAGSSLAAQQARPLSPAGTASAQVLGKWVKGETTAYTMGGERYLEGKWIDITYGRPLLRGREAFGGSGAEYGKATNAGAPVWRAGANLSTRIKSEVPLSIGGKTMPAGEYSVFIELKQPTEWTFIVADWAVAPRLNANIPGALFGAFDYTPEKDILRAPMKVESLPFKVEQLEWTFLDMTTDAGRLAVMWDKTIASVPFRVAR